MTHVNDWSQSHAPYSFVVTSGHVCDFVRNACIFGFPLWKWDLVAIRKIPSTSGDALTEYSVLKIVTTESEDIVRDLEDVAASDLGRLVIFRFYGRRKGH